MVQGFCFTVSYIELFSSGKSGYKLSKQPQLVYCYYYYIILIIVWTIAMW